MNSGVVCGGVVSQSMLLRSVKKDPYALMMAFVMPDKPYARYLKLRSAGRHKEADKLFRRYAVSQI